MKYIVDTDALIECLDCVDGMKINGDIYIPLNLTQEFIRRFPKDSIIPEKQDSKQLEIGSTTK